MRHALNRFAKGIDPTAASKPRFAYSLDRETFVGDFETRDAAHLAAVARAQQQLDPPGSVFTARRVVADPPTTGHADAVVSSMIESVTAALGPAAAEPLKSATEHDLAELDASLDKTLRTWLDAHHLHVRATELAGISEHAMPATQSARQSQSSGSDEVQQVGSGDYWAS